MILVTGAAGHTGRALVNQLANMGVPLRALVRDPAKALDLSRDHVELAVADLAQPETLAPVLAGVEKAYLMTSAAPEQVMLHSNFIRAARRAGVSYIVRHSVRGADHGSRVKLGRWHAASQAELEHSGIAWTHLQPVYNMQNFLRFAAQIQSKSAFHAPMKNAAISMVDARDVAAVAAAALTGDGHAGTTYVITGPEPLTFADAATQLSDSLAEPIRYCDCSPDYAREVCKKMGMPEWYVDDLLGFYAFYSTGAGSAVTDTVARLTRHPGRQFRDFVKDYRAAFAD
jgi:uncharacterized protein YbjT (DUF2867 family)